MPLLLLALPLLIVGVLVLALPLSLVQRYRLGTARRRGRRWIANINLVMLTLSAAIFFWSAALTNFWVPHAFGYSLLGLLGGAVLGLIGIALTRWEETGRALHYTPNRWLVLMITVVVVTRLLYGFWRGWHAWHAAGRETSWLVASGAASSLAIGALVLSYYLTYSAGVCWRLRRFSS